MHYLGFTSEAGHLPHYEKLLEKVVNLFQALSKIEIAINLD